MKKTLHKFFEKEYEETKKVHQLESHFKRYHTLPVSKDVIADLKAKYDSSDDLISATLYISDYIIMASEVKQELDDDTRRTEIIEFLHTLPQQENQNWYEIAHITAFAYRIASILRKRYYFQLDKGLSKNIAASRVSSYFLQHFIDFCTKTFSNTTLLWLSILTETAIIQTVFSDVLSRHKELFSGLQADDSGLVANIIMNLSIQELIGETNTSVPIQYINNSYAFFYLDINIDGKQNIVYSSNIGKRKAASAVNKAFKDCVPLLKLDHSSPHLLKYARLGCKLSSSPIDNFFLVNATSPVGQGWFGIVTPVDDINLTEIESLLQLKLENLYTFHKHKAALPALTEREIIVEEEREVEVQEEKKGFFAKLLSIFKKSRPKTKTQKLQKKVKTTNPFEDWTDVFLQEMVVNCVAGIDLGIEIYDEYREDEFAITGVVLSEQKIEQPTLFISEKEVSYPSDLLDPLISIVDFSKVYIENIVEKDLVNLIPEEVFYLDKQQNIPRLLEFISDNSTVIGLLADKFKRTVQHHLKEVAVHKRRVIIRKTRELLSTYKSSRRTSIEDAGKRILAQDISWENITSSYEDKPVAYFKSSS